VPKNITHILGIVRTAERREDLMTVLDSMESLSSRVIVGDLAVGWKEIADDKHNSIVLLEVDDKDQNIVESLRTFKEAHGKRHYPFIIISGGLARDKMLQLLRVGVSDFLSLPLTIAETQEAISRLTARGKVVADSSGAPSKKIITFAHASGGMGATTLAVNAAAIINAANHKKEHAACLLDLDLQYGGASIHLDLPGYSPVMDLLSKPERLDREMLEGMMMRHSSGLRVLTTPEAPLPMEAISSEVIEKMLQIAQKRFEYVVVDMPQTMTLWTDTVLKQSKVIYVVMQLNVPSIRQLRRWFSVIEQEGLHNLPIKVVVNRYSGFGQPGQSNISLAQASEALGRKIDYMIANDYDLISASLDKGMPAASVRPKAKFTRQLKTMLHEVAQEIEIPVVRNFMGWEY
jgi:pilus assembly protein CpaE